jgi:hypothetical protein
MYHTRVQAEEKTLENLTLPQTEAHSKRREPTLQRITLPFLTQTERSTTHDRDQLATAVETTEPTRIERKETRVYHRLSKRKDKATPTDHLHPTIFLVFGTTKNNIVAIHPQGNLAGDSILKCEIIDNA